MRGGGIVEKAIGRRGSGCHGFVQKLALIEGDMTGEDDFVGFEVEAMGNKDTKKCEGGSSRVLFDIVWCRFIVNCGGREKVKEIGSHMESFNPKGGGRCAWNRRVRRTLLIVRIIRSALPFY
ncbi:hypothetical protein Tco_0998500 [Tanacetum coccineum]